MSTNPFAKNTSKGPISLQAVLAMRSKPQQQNIQPPIVNNQYVAPPSQNKQIKKVLNVEPHIMEHQGMREIQNVSNQTSSAWTNLANQPAQETLHQSKANIFSNQPNQIKISPVVEVVPQKKVQNLEKDEKYIKMVLSYKLEKHNVYISRNALLNKSALAFDSIKSSKQLQPISSAIRMKTMQQNNKINLALGYSGTQILAMLQKSPNRPLQGSLIYRLLQGFAFYEFQQQRHQIIGKLIKQNVQTKLNANSWQNLQQISTRLGIDRAMAIYLSFNRRNIDINDKRQTQKFFLDQCTLLLKIYAKLNKQRRLSTCKIIRKSEQISVIKHMIQSYTRKFSQNCKIDDSKTKQMGYMLLSLLDLILVTHSESVSEQDLATLLPVIQSISSCKDLSKQTNALFLRLYMKFKNRANVSCLRQGPIASFTDYYMDEYKHGDLKVFSSIMVGLSLINQHEPEMIDLVKAKCQKFVKSMESSTDMNPQRMLLTAMECILLIKETQKINLYNQVKNSLLKILFRNCPLALFSFIDGLDAHSELSLSFVVQNSKRSRQSKAPSVSLVQLNKYLPQAYRIQQSSQSLIVSIFLLNLIQKYSTDAKMVSNFIYQNLDDIQKTLEKFSARLQQSDTLELVELICKYIKLYCSEDHRNKQETSKLINQIHESINCLTSYFGKDKQLSRLMVNISKLALCVLELANPSLNRHNGIQFCEQYSKLMDIPIKIQQIFAQTGQQNMIIISKYCGFLYRQYINIVDEARITSLHNIIVTNTIISLMILQTILLILQDIQIAQIDGLIANVTNNTISSKVITMSFSLLNNSQYQGKNKDSKEYHMLVDVLVAVLHRMFILRVHCDQNTSEFRQVLDTSISQYPHILAKLCVNKLSQFTAISTPKQILSMLAYCEVLYRLLESARHQQLNKKNSIYMDMSINTQPNLVSKFMVSDTSTQNKYMQMLVNAVCSSGTTKQHLQLQVMLSLIAIKFDNSLMDQIKIMGHAEDLAHKAVNLLNLQISFIQSCNIQSKITKEIEWVSRCLHVFQGLFKSGWAKVDEHNGITLTKSLNIFISNFTSISYAQTRGWLQMLLSFFIICQSRSSQMIFKFVQYFSKCPSIDVSLQMSVTLIQLLAVYLKVTNFSSIGTQQIQSKKQSVDILINLLIVIIGGLLSDPGNQPIDQYEARQVPKLVPVVFVAAIKIIQKIKLFYVLHQKFYPSDKIQNLVQVMHKFSKSQIYLTMPERQKHKVQQMLASIAQLLDQQNKFNTNHKQKDKKVHNLVYLHYTQSLVYACMTKRESFLSFFSGIIKQIIIIHRAIRNSREESEFRQHYLLYYFLQRIIQDDTGLLTTLMYEQETSSDSITRLAPTFSQSMLALLQMITSSISQNNQQNKIRLTWDIIIMHRFLQLHPNIAQQRVMCIKILQHCGRYLQLLNFGQSLKHKQKRSNKQQNQGLEQWIGYVQVIGILIIMYRMHRHCHTQYEKLFGFIRTLIFSKIEYLNSNFSNLQSRNTKSQQLPIQPLIKSIDSSRTRQYLKQSIITTVVLVSQTQTSQSLSSGSNKYLNNTNGDLDKKLSLDRFLKVNLMMIAIFDTLLYCRFDRFAIGTQWKSVKAQLASNLAQVLAQYANIYDNFFNKNSSGKDQSEQQNIKSQQNTQLMESMIKGYIQSGQISGSQCYLNKVLGEYLLVQHIQKSKKLVTKLTISNNLVNLDRKQAIGVPWYKTSEDILMGLGHKVTNKFHTLNGKMGGSRIMSLSRDRNKNKSSRYYYN